MESNAKIAARSVESLIDGDKSGEVIVGGLKLVVRKIENDSTDFTIRDCEGRPLPGDVCDELVNTVQKGGYSYRHSMAENVFYVSKPEGDR